MGDGRIVREKGVGLGWLRGYAEGGEGYGWSILRVYARLIEWELEHHIQVDTNNLQVTEMNWRNFEKRNES